MALADIAQVTISLNTSGITRPSFGTPIFLTAHNYFTDRVRTYGSASEVLGDTDSGSNAYAAALQVFGNTPSVAEFKIGRIIADSVITPTTTTTGAIVSFKITDQDGTVVTASHTVTGGNTLADIVDALVADVNGGSTEVTATDGGNFLTVARDAAFPAGDFFISDMVNVSVAAASAGQEDVVDAYNAIKEVDNDWYAVAWEDHTTKADILALADAVEADVKLYFYGSAAAKSIEDTYTPGVNPNATDIVAWLAEGGYMRTVAWWHQDADTDFNELALAGYNLPFDAGNVVWANIQVGVDAAKNGDGNKLTATEQLRLESRNCNYAGIKGSVVYNVGGKVAGDEWIDNIHARDNLQSDLELDLFDLLTNQQGRKIPYTDKGINQVAGIVETRLNYYKNRRSFLTDPIVINVPKAKDILRSDKVARVLRDLTFTATIAGGIQMTEITGVLEI